MIAALGNFQVGIVPGCQLDALWRHHINKGIMGRRGVLMDGRDHLLIGVRAGDFQYGRMPGANFLFPGAETAGDNDLAVFLERFTNCLQ